MITVAMATVSIALSCQLRAADNNLPVFITLNERSHTVQVTMAGQTYIEDTLIDGPIVWWQVKSRDGTIIRSRLNRADKTLVITQENLRTGSSGQMVEGFCSIADTNLSTDAPKEVSPSEGLIADVENLSLLLSVVHIDRARLSNGNELLTVTGRVTNSAKESKQVPPIEAELRSSSGQVIFRWTIQPPKRALPAGASVKFQSDEVVPRSGDDLTLSFVESGK